ncbi:MAG: hypothetical protein LBS10_00080 [Gracilibacteraceae bacterium]|jgi:4-amino-4-deoxy-L-arabinose transferase-like glycosyltransferase|nr:hypothetical protein [Gracilibacteraceae bacterium]
MKIRAVLGSLWLVAAIIPFIGFIAFIWIGIRAKEREWVKAGGIYFLFCFLLPIGGAAAAAAGLLQNPTLTGTLLCAAILATLCSWIHALALRRPYLEKRAEIKAREQHA